MAEGMAEVLRAHQYDTQKRTLHQHCTCGWVGKVLGFDFWEHQAAALTAAGYGLVADAKREAWEEGTNAVWTFMSNQDPRRERPINPYRKASNDDQ